MSGWYIVAAVAAVLLLIGMIPVGVWGEYNASGPFAWVCLGRLQLQVFPVREKPAKAKKETKPKKAKKPAEPVPLPEKIGGALEYAKDLLPVLLDAAGCFWHKLRVDTLELELTVGAADPGDAALRYGQANAALGAFWYPLTRAFHVEDGTARVKMDFDAPGMTLYGSASMSVRIGQILWLGIFFGIKALKAFLTARKRIKVKQQERKAA